MLGREYITFIQIAMAKFGTETLPNPLDCPASAASGWN